MIAVRTLEPADWAIWRELRLRALEDSPEAFVSTLASTLEREAREGEASCSALDGGRPKSSMSHHFRVLRDAGLVRTRGEGTQHLNSLRREELDRRFPGLLNSVIRAPKGKARASK